MLVSVALPVPLYRVFDYLAPVSQDAPASSQNLENQPNHQLTSSPNLAGDDLFADANLTPTTPTPLTNVPALPVIGARVEVSFGRQTLIGIVVAHVPAADSTIPTSKLKPIKRVVDDEPLLASDMLSLAR